MPQSILVAARKFQRLLDYMERVGLDADAMAAAVDMNRRQILAADGDQLLPGSVYSRMYRDAVDQMQTLKRPIPWGAGLGSEAFELMCHSIISSRDLGEALSLAQRFDRLLYPLIGYRMRIERQGTTFALHYLVRLSAEDNVFAPEGWDRAEHTEAVSHASGLLVWYGLCGWLIGRSIELKAVRIAAPYVSDAYQEALVDVFHCPVEFDAPDTCFVAPARYLEHLLVHTHDSLQEFLDNAVYQLISANRKPSSTSAAIRSLIRRDFTKGIPSFEQMANALHMSESSLRRRLLKEETSYQSIKDQVRCEIAIEHLRREGTRIGDLAELLGFTEPSSFVRSFRGWTGVTPKVYRDSLQHLS
jgi:AraC-like DNA-binding protein